MKTVEEIAAYQRAYRAANAGAIKESKKAYRAANVVAKAAYSRAQYVAHAKEINERNRARRAANPEAAREYAKAYHAANPEISRAANNNRRAKKRAAGGKHTSADIQRLYLSQRAQCIVCRTSLKDGYHVDHIFPVSTGGDNGPLNLQLLCPPCNQSKSAKDPIDFMQTRGFLL